MPIVAGEVALPPALGGLAQIERVDDRQGFVGHEDPPRARGVGFAGGVDRERDRARLDGIDIRGQRRHFGLLQLAACGAALSSSQRCAYCDGSMSAGGLASMRSIDPLSGISTLPFTSPAGQLGSSPSQRLSGS